MRSKPAVVDVETPLLPASDGLTQSKPTDRLPESCPAAIAMNAIAGLRSRKRGAALEQAIREAVFVEITQQGYAGLTMDAVAARAKTGKASIYRRWPNKLDLVLDALFARLDEESERATFDNLPENVTTRAALIALGRRIVEFVSVAGEAMRAVSCEANRDPKTAGAVKERLHEPTHDAVVALLERGARRGEVSAGVDLDLIAQVLPAMLTHQMLLVGRAVTDADIERIVDGILLPLLANTTPSGRPKPVAAGRLGAP
ncbi:TetR family transcriptional regulator [Jatrophihabitans sp. GAS493]|uniref:TetR/AcrR family transcriptional regulator n=1 Tax=Jatrophihabitans sp. GAS493 TaxID=1907575 RepID=UPI000BB7E771|nr:TetR/AcrR family transcriptional regulator [Jatrophihabitans sp. GAS493]SOD70793.1 TetR family transcriptional regulator [Jatrophihabitans sp. GAS493]